MSLNFDANSFLASMLVSSIGFVLFMYGKRMRRGPQLVSGLILMIYPYFVPSILPMFAIAVVLLFLTWLAVKRGF